MGSGWINFLIFVLVIGAPAAGSIWKKLEEKKEQRRIESARQRLREEQLRTGRVQTLQESSSAASSAASTPRTPSSSDIDAQRRARLEELRRRQQERLRQAAQARAPSPAQPGAQAGRAQVRSIPSSASAQSSSAAPRPVSRSAPRRPAPPRAQPVRPQQARSSSQQGRSSRQVSTAVPPARSQPFEQDPHRVELSAALDFHENAESQAAAARAGSSLGTLFGKARPTVSDLRRAILLREVFDPPVSMRDQPPGSF